MLRLDDLANNLAQGGAATLGDSNSQPTGLAVGTAVKSFHLPDLNGKMVALEDFSGKRALLINWNPGCGFCDLIAPELAKLQPDFHKRNVQLVLIAHGDAEANRKLATEHGLECPILLQKQSESWEPFKFFGTPVAYLLNEKGKVAQPIAVGAEQVPVLAREAISDAPNGKRLPGEKPLSESRIERTGLKAGTLAPTFSLPDVDGRTVSLENFRGKRTLLVFSDPHCGPCDQLAPHLVRLHREHRDNNLAVIMVGRGDVEENRQKARQHGFEFPVVLQDKWKLSKEYGIFATPVAFLIDERGVIARNVAQGPDEILSLAKPHLSEGQE